MKTIVLVFLSVFLTKTCQQKKEKPAEVAVALAEQQVIAKEEPLLETKSEIVEEKTQTGTTIAYEALSRGSYNKVFFDNNQILYTANRDSKPVKIALTKTDVDALLALVKEIKLEKISELKAPTEARTYDGAAHANITINAKGKEYIGNGFDAGKPPKELEKLVTKLLSFTTKK